MRIIASPLTLGVLILGLVACSTSSNHTPESGADAQQPEVAPEPVQVDPLAQWPVVNDYFRYSTDYMQAAKAGAGATTNLTPDQFPVFKMAVSEYPSWSLMIYGGEVAGLVNPDEGGTMSALEMKWQVDLVIVEQEYDPCITSYTTGQVDASALTNIDSLAIVSGRPGVAIYPTSTSAGGDGLLVDSTITSWDDLKGQTVWGLEDTVSEYAFQRMVQQAGYQPSDFTYKMKDPGVAQTAMIQRQDGVHAISVWNPFKTNVLQARPDDVREMSNSSVAPLEIIDLMLMGEDSLRREGGDRAAALMADYYYELNKRLTAPATREATLLGIASKFADFDVPTMERIITETSFFGTPDAGIGVVQSNDLREATRPVLEFVSAL